jgi:hypothetical protein
MKPSNELCGVEFLSQQVMEDFLKRKPQLADTTILSAGEYRIILFFMAECPTRDIQEIFDDDGKHLATFIGPDALECTYQIKVGGYRPEAFQ